MENPFAIMLAQLKTVVLIKEAIKLAFFRLVEYLEHQHLWVPATHAQKLRYAYNYAVDLDRTLKFLKLDTLMYLPSCSVVHRASHSFHSG